MVQARYPTCFRTPANSVTVSNRPRTRSEQVDIGELIERLKLATAADRGIDNAIAQLQGWRKREVKIPDPQTGTEKTRTLWLVPSSNDESNPPRYTANLNDAYHLANQVAPGLPAGCTWAAGEASAKIGKGPVCHAPTPMLALCVAAMITMQNQRQA